MSGRTNRDRRERLGEPAAEAASEAARPDVAAVPEPTRGGEDSRRRGWFWHWNSLVTQYAPLIGLKGIGLLNSYTVWTDRRAESPHRGYAFPSQQSEADFYGEDRAELIAINKILVALDLIEIRKEMVLRADPQGRRWRVPHNFYRVKDHDDGFALASGDVLRVAELAARDRAVYRYVRRVFSPRFAPIDGDNVWHRILPEARQHPLWRQLAERAEREDARASDRTRAGHAARKPAGPNPANASTEAAASGAPEGAATGDFFAPGGGAAATTRRSRNDSRSATTPTGDETFVASSDNGSPVGVAPANNGLAPDRPSAVAPASEAGPTAVARSNRTYHQSHTTTNERSIDNNNAGPIAPGPVEAQPAPEPLRHQDEPMTAPGDGPAEAAAIRAFEEANARAATPAE
ncbi:MAG TPA: hypothetical protein VFX03_14030, partial [Thermomicrobiales bacterium]|nr:hypothetical protein [Thermomicrobiales bacterium]